ncbi:hypothetical protein IFM89_008319 [Coptis chinensis]|uniref:Maintenance of Photosystem II under High light 2 C-terminal domain-containing protein n=1 Tax=Coptis chinensis TaxID=261450 RepID=A0A835IB04_9MAGN|nr:hypothetical protein IFM89_008319 [Coptis chinensis]
MPAADLIKHSKNDWFSENSNLIHEKVPSGHGSALFPTKTEGTKMATTLLSSTNILFNDSLVFSSVSFPSTATITGRRSNSYSLTRIMCKAANVSSSSSPEPDYSPVIMMNKRSLFAFSLATTTTLALSLANISNAAILEADDDIELLEKVKKDRKKRLERQEMINASNKEAAYVQEVVYKLSKAGQAIENNDLTAASSVLGPSTDADWVKKGNVAFKKLSSNLEEKTEVDTFNSSLASLISSVAKDDIRSSKVAFISSASALEKWTALTGLAALLKGL